MRQAIEKAAGMIEALPFIQRFRNETVVVKFGGSILEDETACRSILQDICFMEVVGLRPAVVHGGGKLISRRMEEARLTPVFHHGLRVTDDAAMAVVDAALNGEVNPHLCAMVESMDCAARGIRGQDVLTVKQRIGTDPDTGEPMNWGLVGEVTGVAAAALVETLDAQAVPLMTPIGRGEDGTLYNINADDAAAALARAIGARKLVYLSDVPGLLEDPEDPDSIIPHVEAAEAEALIARGVIRGGMIPKIRSAVETTRAGVNKVHIVDSSQPHSLLLELFTEKGVGTEIVRS